MGIFQEQWPKYSNKITPTIPTQSQLSYLNGAYTKRKVVS